MKSNVSADSSMSEIVLRDWGSDWNGEDIDSPSLVGSTVEMLPEIVCRGINEANDDDFFIRPLGVAGRYEGVLRVVRDFSRDLRYFPLDSSYSPYLLACGPIFGILVCQQVAGTRVMLSDFHFQWGPAARDVSSSGSLRTWLVRGIQMTKQDDKARLMTLSPIDG